MTARLVLVDDSDDDDQSDADRLTAAIAGGTSDDLDAIVDPAWDDLSSVIDRLDGLDENTARSLALKFARWYCGDNLDGLTPFGNHEQDVMCWVIRTLARETVAR